jgi:dihydroflavonol-4-reductase
MKTILITGATGFLGRHLADQLRAAEPDSRLRILCRGPAPRSRDAGLEIQRGDVLSRHDVMRAAEGATQIYHLAGLVSRDPREAEVLFRTHIEGTRNICEAALTQGAEKVVIASSSGTIAVSREPVMHDETATYKHEIVGAWPYYLSKIFQEKLALDYFARRKLPVVIINPSLLLGPGDERQSSTRDVALFLEGQILATPRGGLNFVDVRDVAAGTIAAMRQGRAGERYLLGGVNWTFRELIGTVARISRRRAPRLQPPYQLALHGAHCLRRIYRLVGKSFKLDDASIQMAACFWYCDSAKAQRALNFATRSPLETLKDTVEDVRRRLKP